MSETPIFFNPNTNQKPPEPKEKMSLRKKEPSKSTRSIRFKKRGVQHVITYFFWLLFVLMIGFLSISYVRYNYILVKINEKEVNPQEILSTVSNGINQEEVIKFESKQFVTQLFHVNKELEEERKDYLDSRLAKGLSSSQLFQVKPNQEQVVKSVELVENKHTSKKSNQYELTYEVVFLVENVTKSVRVKLPISYENQDFKVINYPVLLSSKKSQNLVKNSIGYKESDYYTKGEEVPAAEKEVLEQFVVDFLELYGKNDGSLKLISNVQGLDDATISNIQIKNRVKKGKNYVVEGTYKVSYDKQSEITSFFSLTISPTKDSYFVEKIN